MCNYLNFKILNNINMTTRYKKFIFEFDTALFLKDKYAKKILLNIFYKDGNILIKPDKRYTPIGTYDQVTISEFLKIKNMSRDWVYISNQKNTIYKIVFDIEILNDIANKSELFSEELKYLLTFISHNNNDPSFYTVGLTTSDDISDKLLVKNYGKKYRSLNLDEYEFLILETADLYPNQQSYKLIFK